jgi:hypothetical protein
MSGFFRVWWKLVETARKSVTKLYNLVFRLTSVKLYACHVSPFCAFSRNIVRDPCVTTVHVCHNTC